ncbi:MAG: CarD family transcriptional regulator, partial [Hyphomicrobiaceae bacterium]
IFMAQKKSVSAKSTAKTPAKKKTSAASKSKTVARKAVKKAPVTAARKTAAKPVSKTVAKKPASKAVTATKRAAAKPAARKAAVKKPDAKATPKAASKTTKSVKSVKKTEAKKLPPRSDARRLRTAATTVANKTAASKSGAAKALPKKVAAKPAAKQVKAVAAAVAKPVAKQSTPVTAVASKAAQPAQDTSMKKPSGQRHGFKTNEFVVYPAHGVGQIIAIEDQEIAGVSLELFVITFEKDKMTLRVPTGKHEGVGMRKLAEGPVVDKAMTTLKGRARIKRTMWSRRAQEYEAKINSGDLISIAEVVRDLYRSDSQPEQSYSERQLYEQALDRMAREIAAIEKLDERGAIQRITDVLSKSAKGRRAAEEAAEEEAAAASADVEAA